MESRGQRGFKKGKLVMTFYRALAKPPPNKKPTNMAPPPSTAVAGGRQKPREQAGRTTAEGGGGSQVNFIVKQDQVGPPTNAKVSFFVPEADHNNGGHGFYDKNFGDLFGVVEDEAVDLKAASYISTVQERFHLERCNTDYKRN
ncbi:hypothetical protein LIER_13723 [Lithospermum erythrorhizon]|uniref:Uncharacterized protein n=1 Tax=Lithospermum erythrorhizon TaxID=34254 RepID=A0AAV3Q0M9_LITER